MKYLKTNDSVSIPNLLETVAVTILFIFILTVTSCTGPERYSGTVNDRKHPGCGEPGFIEGWCDENTYRIIQTAPPSAKSRTDNERRLSSKKLAIFTAQERILEKFKDLGLDVLLCEVDTDAYIIAAEVRESIKNGKVISEEWDENFNCDIIFEVYSRQLKKKVKNSAFTKH